MYFEFLLLIFDYFRTLRWGYIVYEWLLPMAVSVAMFYVIDNNTTLPTATKFVSFAKEVASGAVSLLGILVGFSITVITLLNTTNTPNIEKVKNIKTKFHIGAMQLSLFHLLLINLTYAVVIEVLNLVFNICLPWTLEKGGLTGLRCLLCVDLFFVLHVLLLNLRNMTDFYFILFKPENLKKRAKKG